MQCILTVAVAAVVTASHTELQAKSSPLALFSLLFPPCPPFILAITTFFFSLTYKKPSPETNIILWISFYLSHASGRDKQMPFQDKKKKKRSWLTGAFPHAPGSTTSLCLPFCFLPSCSPRPFHVMDHRSWQPPTAPSRDAPAGPTRPPLPRQCSSPMGLTLTPANLWPSWPQQADSVRALSW